ncbi:Threonine aldolase [Methylocella silvestris BL2]|uniref:L-threonine aldolase n=2 Tax=Methylocella silvestris TaxID=199596 RepID=B8EMS9_METSB|nr:Threonine aldolase [Methylocella silvestris BL2]
MMDFTSDNTSGVSEKIMQAILKANAGSSAAYGVDPFTARASALLSEIFEKELAVFLVATGTAANALALGALCPPWGAVFCHARAHIFEDECGAPEMFTAGAKLVGVAGEAGRIAPSALRESLAAFPRGAVKQVQPAALSLSQATEAGAVYDLAELTELCRIAHDAGLGVHMDGARFANALVELNCSPAEMSWKAGIDILSFGATKNGALACEAIIVFDPAKAASLPFQRKRGGHLLSKGRFLGAQMAAYLENGHWLDNARVANAHAARLAAGLAEASGVRMPWPRQANEVFAILPARADAALRAAGVRYYDWSDRDFGEMRRDGEVFVRLLTSFATQAAEVDAFIALARG